MKSKRSSYLGHSALLALALLLSGCAQQLIREEATTRLREGQYEAAISGLEQGLRQYPDSAVLRSNLIATRNEAVARLVTDAAQLRAQARFDDAERILLRAAVLDRGSERIQRLQADIASDRRAHKQLEEIQALIGAGKPQAALRAVEAALRAAPRHAALVSLQRQLDTQLRLNPASSGQTSLAETRPVTLDFRNAPLPTVLDAITRSSGINFILDRDVRQESRVTVHLRQARVEDAIDLVIGAGQLARKSVDAQTVLIYPNTPEKQREHQDQVIRVFYLANSEARQAAAMLRNLLRIREPFIDERANIVALRESPEIIALAERLIALQDVGDAEVMLEVEVLEIKTTRLTELGLSFPSSVNFTTLPGAGDTGLTVSSLRAVNSDRVGVSVGSLLLNLRREVGDFNTLANPRIRTKNREKARVLIGDKVPVITSTASSTGFVAESVNYLDVGLKLDVEPVVSPDDDVTIKLGLEVSSLVKEVRTPGGSLAYQIGTRNANTTLRLRDGETQLLAGLISNDDRSSSNRVPGLGDLPVAGRLFSSQKDDVQRTELVLAITPRILRSAPRPDVSMAEMWVGTEQATRLRVPPGRDVIHTDATPQTGATAATAGVPVTSTSRNAEPAAAPMATPAKVVWQAPAEVKIGEPFVALLNLDAGALRGASLELTYPSQFIEVVDITEGTFFKQGDAATSFTQTVNVANGRMGAAVLRNEANGVGGQGSIVRLQLKARAAGAFDIGILSLKPIGAGGGAAAGDLPVLRIGARP